ncbi:MAG: collagen-like protein [Nitrosopumilus sp.]|nr:collagen-like protein [Nitrosopumilus sp.]
MNTLISFLSFLILVISIWTSSSTIVRPAIGLEFDFGGPNGFHFDLGDFPTVGEQGPLGPQGDPGPQGEKGDKGDKGDTGAQGLQGEKGDKGDKGDAAPSQDLTVRTVEGNVARDGTCVDGCSDTEKSVASCNSDEVLTGGGFHKSGLAWTTDSKPVGNSWEAKGQPRSAQDVSYTQAYAQCQKLEPQS